MKNENWKQLAYYLEDMAIAAIERPCCSKEEFDAMNSERIYSLSADSLKNGEKFAEPMNVLTGFINAYYWSANCPFIDQPAWIFEEYADVLKGENLKTIYNQIRELPPDKWDNKSGILFDLAKVCSSEFESAGIDPNEAFENSWYASGDCPDSLFENIWEIYCKLKSFNADKAIEFYFKRVYPDTGRAHEDEDEFWELLRDKLIKDTTDLSFMREKSNERLLAMYGYLMDCRLLQMLLQRKALTIDDLKAALDYFKQGDPEDNGEMIADIELALVKAGSISC